MQLLLTKVDVEAWGFVLGKSQKIHVELLGDGTGRYHQIDVLHPHDAIDVERGRGATDVGGRGLEDGLTEG